MSHPRITLTDSDTQQAFTVPADQVGLVKSRAQALKATVTIAGSPVPVDETRAAIEAEMLRLWDKSLDQQPQLLYFWTGAVSPADSTTYFWGRDSSVTTTSQAGRRIYFPFAATIRGAGSIFAVDGVLGTSEAATLYLRKNNAADTLLSANVLMNAASNVAWKDDLELALVAGDYLEFKIVTPAWATNPTNVYFSSLLKVQTT